MGRIYSKFFPSSTLLLSFSNLFGNVVFIASGRVLEFPPLCNDQHYKHNNQTCPGGILLELLFKMIGKLCCNKVTNFGLKSAHIFLTDKNIFISLKFRINSGNYINKILSILIHATG